MNNTTANKSFDLENGFELMKAYITEVVIDDETTQQQLRAMWTTYCLVNMLEPDTYAYDQKIMDLYAFMEDKNNIELFPDFEDFDMYMGDLLC